MQGSRRINKPLTNISVRYDNEEYIANKFLRNVPVKKESDIYYIYNNDLRQEEVERANKTAANMVTFDVSTTNYSLTEYALKDVITKRDRENVDAPLMLDRDTTEYLTSKIQLKLEDLAHKLLFTTTSFSNNTTLVSTTSWRLDTTTVSPIQNVLSATSNIINNAGGKANEAATSLAVVDTLKENSQIYSRIENTDRALLTPELLAAIFDLKKLWVGTAVNNTAQEGQAQSLSPIWGNQFLVGNFQESPRLKTRTTAVYLRMNQFGMPWQVRKWFEDDLDGDMIEVRTIASPRIVASTSGYLIKDCIV